MSFRVTDAEMAKMIGDLQEIAITAAKYKAERDSFERENNFLRALLTKQLERSISEEVRR